MKRRISGAVRKRRTDTRAAVRAVVRIQRGLITEVGQLRVLLLEIRQEMRATVKYEGYCDFRDGLIRDKNKTQ